MCVTISMIVFLCLVVNYLHKLVIMKFVPFVYILLQHICVSLTCLSDKLLTRDQQD